MENHPLNDKQILLKFPAVLKNKLLNNELCFPVHTQFEYTRIHAYRCVNRAEADDSAINRMDFYSHIENAIFTGEKIRKKRGQVTEPEEDINYYGVSLFTDKRILANVMKLPKPAKKICSGFVFQEGGPQATDDKHVNWWLFDDVDLSNFKIVKDVGHE